MDTKLPPDAFRVGDVLTMQGPSVPRELWTRNFQVVEVDRLTGLPRLRLLPPDGETPAQFHERARLALRRANGSPDIGADVPGGGAV